MQFHLLPCIFSFAVMQTKCTRAIINRYAGIRHEKSCSNMQHESSVRLNIVLCISESVSVRKWLRPWRFIVAVQCTYLSNFVTIWAGLYCAYVRHVLLCRHDDIGMCVSLLHIVRLYRSKRWVQSSFERKQPNCVDVKLLAPRELIIRHNSTDQCRARIQISQRISIVMTSARSTRSIDFSFH